MNAELDERAFDILSEASGLQRLTASFYRVKELSITQTVSELESEPEEFTQRFLEFLANAKVAAE